MTMKNNKQHTIPIEYRGLKFDAIIPNFDESILSQCSSIALVPNETDKKYRYIAFKECNVNYRLSVMISAVIWHCMDKRDTKWDTIWYPANMMILDLVTNNIVHFNDPSIDMELAVSTGYDMIRGGATFDDVPKELTDFVLGTITVDLLQPDSDGIIYEYFESDKITSWNLPMENQEPQRANWVNDVMVKDEIFSQTN